MRGSYGPEWEPSSTKADQGMTLGFCTARTSCISWSWDSYYFLLANGNNREKGFEMQKIGGKQANLFFPCQYSQFLWAKRTWRKLGAFTFWSHLAVKCHFFCMVRESDLNSNRKWMRLFCRFVNFGPSCPASILSAFSCFFLRLLWCLPLQRLGATQSINLSYLIHATYWVVRSCSLTEVWTIAFFKHLNHLYRVIFHSKFLD